MSTTPLYHRLFLTLRDQIINGSFDWQVPLPSENKLCKEYGVSRATVRRALELLGEEGLIEKRQGARTYARPLRYQPVQRSDLGLLMEQGRHRELLPGTIRQTVEKVSPDTVTARQFGSGEQLGRVTRVRESEGRPYCFIASLLPLAIAERIDWAQLGNRPVISAAVEAGEEFSHVEQAISATIADEEVAAALAVEIGSPLLRVSGLFLAESGAAVMRKDGFFLPDSFEYRFTLRNGVPD